MWNKLKHEWKTASWGVLCSMLEIYDSIAAPFLQSTPVIPDKYKWVDALVIPTIFLLLRRWRDQHKDAE